MTIFLNIPKDLEIKNTLSTAYHMQQGGFLADHISVDY